MSLLKTLRIAFILATALTSLSAFAGPPLYNSLKRSRPFLKLPEYSLEQKKLVLSQTRIILEDIYVHKDLKIKNYGQAANPTPALNKIQAEIETISTESFHAQISDIFKRFHDLHTLYYLPKPFACNSSFLPFGLKEVIAANGKKVIAVTGVRNEEEITKFLPAGYELNAGDILISYNGLPVEKAIELRMPVSYGANPSAARKIAIEDLRDIGHNLSFLPAKDTVDLEFLRADGKKVKFTIPWIVWTDWSCKGEANALAAKEKKSNIMMAGLADQETSDSVLYWNINKETFGNFGYLEILSFNPEELSIRDIVLKVKSLLQNELKNTDGLIIDLRENTGGQLPFAEKLIQLISPKQVTPHNYVLKASKSNSFYFNTVDPLNHFTVALNDAIATGAKFTKKLGIDSKEEINTLGQVYFKPVAVYVDAKCYSACDTFAAQVQDHKVATVFGEDATTGGGGANVFSLNQLIEDFTSKGLDSGRFKTLPAGQNISFSLRQASRVGANLGVAIEDVGIKVDRLSPANMSDIFNSNRTQIMVLMKYLEEQSPKYTSNIFLKNEARQDFKIKQKAKINASWNDTNLLDFKLAGNVIESRAIAKKATNSTIDVPAQIATDKIGDGSFEMYGKNSGKNAWRKVINYRIIPENTVIGTGKTLSVNLQDERGIALYNDDIKSSQGWNISNNALHLGNGSNYADMAHVEAALFLQLPQASYELKFEASVKIEQDLDSLKVVAIVEGQTFELVTLTGDLENQEYKIDLSQFSGKAVELRFVFDSDQATSDDGITIKNISVKPM